VEACGDASDAMGGNNEVVSWGRRDCKYLLRVKIRSEPERRRL
jgi:hypothetical protein